MKLPIDAESSQAFTEVAQSARMSGRLLRSVGDPRPDSNFARIGAIYPFEKPSDWCRAYLGAALEHLTLWADYVAPLRFHESQETMLSLRPAYTLARAALESSAQAVWMLTTRDPMECIRRHLSLMRWDLQEHRKSKLDLAEKEKVKAREQLMLDRVSTVFAPEQISPPGGYLAVIKDACGATDLDIDAEDAERIWRAASGSAHGKYWPSIDLQDILPGEEYEPGHFRAIRFPDPKGMAEVLKCADGMTTYGVLKFADYSGADIGELILEAQSWLAEVIPFRADADPSVIGRLKSGKA